MKTKLIFFMCLIYFNLGTVKASELNHSDVTPPPPCASVTLTCGAVYEYCNDYTTMWGMIALYANFLKMDEMFCPPRGHHPLDVLPF